jgi:hypothetical protein
MDSPGMNCMISIWNCEKSHKKVCIHHTGPREKTLCLSANGPVKFTGEVPTDKELLTHSEYSQLRARKPYGESASPDSP